MQVQVKICGLTNCEDAALAATLGADYLGFIFAESPRKVLVAAVVDILRALHEQGLRGRMKAVGVFVNETVEHIEQVIQETGIDIVQLHGDETSAAVQACSFPWYKSLRVSTTGDVDRYIVQEQWTCSRLLIDTKVEGIYGGTGIPVAEEVAQYAKEKITGAGKEFFLAGGISPDNVFSILERIQPDGIDVGSGIEECKGKKSREKMAQLFKEINRYKKEFTTEFTEDTEKK